MEEVENSLCEAIFHVEKETGAYIGFGYPLLKFYSQVEELNKYREKEREASSGNSLSTLG